MLKHFELATLSDFDNGRLRLVLERLLATAVADCRDRPGVASARSVTLKLLLVPVADETGDVDTVRLDYKLAATVPTMAREGLSLSVQRDNRLVFNDLSPHDARQRTIDQDDDLAHSFTDGVADE